jgi:hypothetical protein
MSCPGSAHILLLAGCVDSPHGWRYSNYPRADVVLKGKGGIVDTLWKEQRVPRLLSESDLP